MRMLQVLNFVQLLVYQFQESDTLRGQGRVRVGHQNQLVIYAGKGNVVDIGVFALTGRWHDGDRVSKALSDHMIVGIALAKHNIFRFEAHNTVQIVAFDNWHGVPVNDQIVFQIPGADRGRVIQPMSRTYLHSGGNGFQNTIFQTLFCKLGFQQTDTGLEVDDQAQLQFLIRYLADHLVAQHSGGGEADIISMLVFPNQPREGMRKWGIPPEADIKAADGVFANLTHLVIDLANAFCIFQDPQTVSGGDKTFLAAVENRKAQFVLQIADSCADTGIGDKQVTCSLADRVGIAHFQKIM